MNEGIHLDLDTWIVPGQIRYIYRYINDIYKAMTRACLALSHPGCGPGSHPATMCACIRPP